MELCKEHNTSYSNASTWHTHLYVHPATTVKCGHVGIGMLTTTVRMYSGSDSLSGEPQIKMSPLSAPDAEISKVS